MSVAPMSKLRRKSMRSCNIRSLAVLLLIIAVLFSGCVMHIEPEYSPELDQIPVFSTDAYVVVNKNEPIFTEEQLVTQSYEFYSELDALNRCGYAMACIGRDIMPTEERGSIGQVKPTGWQTVKYDFVDGKYLYNRCHLIGYQLTGENANEKNLITGTRYLNVEGMLPFENMVADYVKETGNHVLYRVTPVFEGTELVARGVQMEALSVEDEGEGVCFNVYAYNNQPGVIIDYADGTSKLDASAAEGEQLTYILNTNSKKFHDSSCQQGKSISDQNRQVTTTTRQMLINQGFEPAGCCKP